MQNPETPPRQGLFGDAGRTLFWAAVTILVFVGVILAARGVPWDLTWQALSSARPGWLIAALAANCAMFPLWASQWRWLTPPAQCPPWRRMFEIVAVTSATQNILPMLGGQATALGLLILRGGLTRGAALSVVALDQMLTGLGKLATLGAAALAAPMPDLLRQGALTLTALMAAFLAALIVLAYSTALLERWALQPGRIARAMAVLAEWTRHLDGLRRGGKPVWWGLLYAILKKTCEVLAALAIQYACGIGLGWGGAILVVAALGLSTLVRTPGNLGVYEATVVAIYSALGVPAAPALAAALLQHAASLLPRLGIGAAVLLIRRPGLASN